jgi:LacI family transcriptional regulator
LKIRVPKDVSDHRIRRSANHKGREPSALQRSRPSKANGTRRGRRLIDAARKSIPVKSQIIATELIMRGSTMSAPTAKSKLG